jgi:hypothetical protein
MISSRQSPRPRCSARTCAPIARERQIRIYENVTRAIVEEMERGAVPWVRPWKTHRRDVGSVMPGNASAGRSYSGHPGPLGERRHERLSNTRVG